MQSYSWARLLCKPSSWQAANPRKNHWSLVRLRYSFRICTTKSMFFQQITRWKKSPKPYIILQTCTLTRCLPSWLPHWLCLQRRWSSTLENLFALLFWKLLFQRFLQVNSSPRSRTSSCLPAFAAFRYLCCFCFFLAELFGLADSFHLSEVDISSSCLGLVDLVGLVASSICFPLLRSAESWITSHKMLKINSVTQVQFLSKSAMDASPSRQELNALHLSKVTFNLIIECKGTKRTEHRTFNQVISFQCKRLCIRKATGWFATFPDGRIP